MYEINTWTKQWKDCCVSDVIKLNCCLLSTGLLLKSQTVCYSTTGASMRNTTSLPWKSSMSRYSSPSLQVEHLLVYLFIMIYWKDAFFFLFHGVFVLSVLHLVTSDCFPGETKTTVSPYIPGGVSDGQWHAVEVHYYNKVWSLINEQKLLKCHLPTDAGSWLFLKSCRVHIFSISFLTPFMNMKESKLCFNCCH